MSENKGYTWSGYREETSHILQIGISLIFFYSLFIDLINKIVVFTGALSGNPEGFTTINIPDLTPVLPPIIQFPPAFPFPDPIVLVIVRCFFLVIITYYIAFWICRSVWVPVLINTGECYDNFALKCAYIWVIKYYLRIVCTPIFRWIIVIVGVICIITGIGTIILL